MNNPTLENASKASIGAVSVDYECECGCGGYQPLDKIPKKCNCGKFYKISLEQLTSKKASK